MTKISLYYADWCGHCTSFKPTWNSLKKMFKKNDIEYAEFEDSKNKKEVENANIQGFPTIKIEKDGVEYDYKGSRNVNDIIHEVLPNFQIGGSRLVYKIIYH